MEFKYSGSLYRTSYDAAQASIMDYYSACGTDSHKDALAALREEWPTLPAGHELRASMEAAGWGLPEYVDNNDLELGIEAAVVEFEEGA